jgi:fucose permease
MVFELWYTTMQKRTRYILLIVILYGTMLIFGTIDNIKGVSFPLIKAEFNASYEQQGLMVSLLTAVYVFFCILAGIFLGRFGVKRAFLSGFAFMGAGLIAVFFMPRFWPAAGALLLVYAGFGFFEVGINALATQVFTSKAALLMNLLHFFYGAGAVIGPKGAGILTEAAGLGMGWRWVYLWSLPLAALFFIPTLLTPFPEADAPAMADASATADAPASAAANASANAAASASSDAAGSSGRGGEKKPSAGPGRATFLTALKTPMVWVFGVTLGLMVTIEMSTANWGGLYFQDVYGVDPSTGGANFVAAFFTLFTLSRLVSGFLVEKIGYIRSLLGACLITALIFAAGFIAGGRGIWVLPALGFFIAIMWPTLMAAAIGFFGAESPVMTSAIIAISGTLNAVVQLIIGYSNRFLGAAWGYRGCLIYALLLVGMVLFLRNRLCRHTIAS